MQNQPPTLQPLLQLALPTVRSFSLLSGHVENFTYLGSNIRTWMETRVNKVQVEFTGQASLVVQATLQ